MMGASGWQGLDGVGAIASEGVGLSLPAEVEYDGGGLSSLGAGDWRGRSGLEGTGSALSSTALRLIEGDKSPESPGVAPKGKTGGHCISHDLLA